MRQFPLTLTDHVPFRSGQRDFEAQVRGAAILNGDGHAGGTGDEGLAGDGVPIAGDEICGANDLVSTAGGAVKGYHERSISKPFLDPQEGLWIGGGNEVLRQRYPRHCE